MTENDTQIKFLSTVAQAEASEQIWFLSDIMSNGYVNTLLGGAAGNAMFNMYDKSMHDTGVFTEANSKFKSGIAESSRRPGEHRDFLNAHADTLKNNIATTSQNKNLHEFVTTVKAGSGGSDFKTKVVPKVTSVLDHLDEVFNNGGPSTGSSTGKLRILLDATVNSDGSLNTPRYRIFKNHLDNAIESSFSKLQTDLKIHSSDTAGMKSLYDRSRFLHGITDERFVSNWVKFSGLADELDNSSHMGRMFKSDIEFRNNMVGANGILESYKRGNVSSGSSTSIINKFKLFMNNSTETLLGKSFFNANEGFDPRRIGSNLTASIGSAEKFGETLTSLDQVHDKTKIGVTSTIANTDSADMHTHFNGKRSYISTLRTYATDLKGVEWGRIGNRFKSIGTGGGIFGLVGSIISIKDSYESAREELSNYFTGEGVFESTIAEYQKRLNFKNTDSIKMLLNVVGATKQLDSSAIEQLGGYKEFARNWSLTFDAFLNQNIARMDFDLDGYVKSKGFQTFVSNLNEAYKNSDKFGKFLEGEDIFTKTSGVFAYSKEDQADMFVLHALKELPRDAYKELKKTAMLDDDATEADMFKHITNGTKHMNADFTYRMPNNDKDHNVVLGDVSSRPSINGPIYDVNRFKDPSGKGVNDSNKMTGDYLGIAAFYLLGGNKELSNKQYDKNTGSYSFTLDGRKFKDVDVSTLVDYGNRYKNVLARMPEHEKVYNSIKDVVVDYDTLKNR